MFVLFILLFIIFLVEISAYEPNGKVFLIAGSYCVFFISMSIYASDNDTVTKTQLKKEILIEGLYLDGHNMYKYKYLDGDELVFVNRSQCFDNTKIVIKDGPPRLIINYTAKNTKNHWFFASLDRVTNKTDGCVAILPNSEFLEILR